MTDRIIYLTLRNLSPVVAWIAVKAAGWTFWFGAYHQWWSVNF